MSCPCPNSASCRHHVGIKLRPTRAASISDCWTAIVGNLQRSPDLRLSSPPRSNFLSQTPIAKRLEAARTPKRYVRAGRVFSYGFLAPAKVDLPKPSVPKAYYFYIQILARGSFSARTRPRGMLRRGERSTSQTPVAPGSPSLPRAPRAPPSCSPPRNAGSGRGDRPRERAEPLRPAPLLRCWGTEGEAASAAGHDMMQ